ncbi:hypothetical protein ACWEWI_22605, partial [Streptomyces sp. NPDC003753]
GVLLAPRRPYPSHPQGLRPFNPTRGSAPGTPAGTTSPASLAGLRPGPRSGSDPRPRRELASAATPAALRTTALPEQRPRAPAGELLPVLWRTGSTP